MPIVHRVLGLRDINRRPPDWFHDAAGSWKRGGSEPHSTPHARGCPRASGRFERTVVSSDQPAQESLRLHLPGDRARDPEVLSMGQRVVMATLRLYQLAVSPWLPSACRFHPTCSAYMREAVALHGVPRGVWLGLLRLVKCHPFHAGGVDHVPQRNPRKEMNERTQSV